MARVLIPEHKQWYHELRSIYSYREADVERFVCQHAGSIFADFHVFPFKIDVKATGSPGAKKPDLAMVRKDLSGWGVVEVELGEHKIKHVLDQVGVFVNATYNTAEIAEYLQRQLETYCKVKLKLPQLRKLCRDTMPRVIVLVDSHMENWEPELEKVGVELCTFEIYKDARGVHVFRALGKYPIVEEDRAILTYVKQANLWKISTKFKINGKAKASEIDIKYEDRLTTWTIFKDGQFSYIKHVGIYNPLNPNAQYALLLDTTGVLHFRNI